VPPSMNERTASILARELGAIVGDAYVRVPVGFEARAASVIAEPRDAGEVAELVRKCEADAITLAPLGAARTLAQIRPAPVAMGISLVRMNRVIAYEPDDMTVIAEAGLTLGALNRLTATHGQRLPADPPHPDRTTLGALIAAAQAGPIRLSEGTVRDLLIGVRFVGHDARLIHGGGQVVKNVAGYDLMKVMVGSFGTLGVVTETTFKVRPIPDCYTVAIAQFPDPETALGAAAALHDAVPLIHLEVMSAAVAKALEYAAQPHVFAGFAGNAEELAFLLSQATAILGPASAVVADSEAAMAYERLRDFEANDAAIVAQIAVAPAELAPSLQQCGAEFRAHTGCGVAQIFTSEASNADLQRTLTRWREIARGARGHLRVLRINDEFRHNVKFFDEPPGPALALMRRLKTTFDPRGVFNPGCFVGGI
jgi:glycolate dehydrogenase FAD-binding subunit